MTWKLVTERRGYDTKNLMLEMKGKVFTSLTANGDELIFENSEEKYVFYHEPDCCEQVFIDDICGDLKDLEGVPLLIVDESVSDNVNPEGVIKEYQDSFTWTFYKFATIKGYVDVRWYGESNGYYSESVNLKKYIKE